MGNGSWSGREGLIGWIWEMHPGPQEPLPYMKETDQRPLWMLNNTACLEKGVGDGSRVGIGGSLPRESTYDCWLTVASSHLLPHNCRAIIILRLRMS